MQKGAHNMPSSYISPISMDALSSLCGELGKNNKINLDYDLSLAQDKKISFVEDLADKDLAFKVHIFLHAMKEPYKEVFNLRVFGELDYKSIGQIFGKTDTRARVTFYRAKNMIIDYLEEENEI